MVIQVNPDLCTGCGVCVETCPSGAIQLSEQRAVIDEALCTECEACLEACPNGAITAFFAPVRKPSNVTLPAVDSRERLPGSEPKILPQPAAPGGSLAPLAGTALAFVGREIAPRLVNVFIAALERRLSRPSMPVNATLSKSYNRFPAQRGGIRRQARFRRGYANNRNSNERR